MTLFIALSIAVSAGFGFLANSLSKMPIQPNVVQCDESRGQMPDDRSNKICQ